jgi:hypothetical protein
MCKFYEDKKLLKRTVSFIIGTFLFTFVYATLRYVIFGPYTLHSIPLFILNKSLAFSSVIFIFVLTVKKITFLSRGIIGITSYIIAIFHGILGAILIPSSYFKKYFNPEGEMLVSFAAMIFFGVLALLLMVFINKIISFGKKDKKFYNAFWFHKIFLFLLAIISLHVFVFCIKDWFNFKNWYGYMPPISLLSFILLFFATLGFLNRVFEKN